jgi:hypothetical protein
MTTSSTLTQPAPESEASRLADKLLSPRFQILDALAMAASLSPHGKKAAEDHKRKKDEARAQLMTLPLDELRTRVAQQEAQAAANRLAQSEADKKRKQEKLQREAQAAAEREAKKFYNQASSSADFRHWATMDYWTFDEALALLMGLDPSIMTKGAMQKEIEPEFNLMLLSQSNPPKSEFVRRYEALRAVAERATAMKPPRLRPVDVVTWAANSGAIAPPNDLVQALVERIKRSQPKATNAPEPQPSAPGTTAHAPASAPNPTSLKRVAMLQKHERAWPTIEADLRHANENGLSAAAKAKAHGYWHEEPALEWAQRNGKLLTPPTSRTATAHTPFGQIHRIDD